MRRPAAVLPAGLIAACCALAADGERAAPPGCPGGSLPECIRECPDSPPAVHTACVVDCGDKCPSGPPAPPRVPLSRDEHTALLVARDAVLITGGWCIDSDYHGGYLNDTWVLNLTTLAWSPLDLRMRPTISAHVAALIPASAGAAGSPPSPPMQLTYGGNNGGAAVKLEEALRGRRAGLRSGDAPNFDSRVFRTPATLGGKGGAWEELNSGTKESGGPGKRVRPAAVSRRPGELTIHGGWPGPDGDKYATMFNDLWHYSMADNKWTDITPADKKNAPKNRYHHVAVYDPAADEMIVHGGYALIRGFLGDEKLVHYADTWHYSYANGTWREGLAAQGSFLPRARMGHTAVWDEKEGAMVIFGGNEGADGGNVNDVWAYRPGSPATWAQLEVTSSVGPEGRNCAAALLPASGRMVVVAGESSETLADAWELTSGDGYRTGAWKRLL